MARQLFLDACEKVVNVKKEHNGIGTLKEKTIHSVLKYYYEPYEDNHEVKLCNYVADIVGEDGIIEIQTQNFKKLYNKLVAFLAATKVTVVYPVIKTSYINWIDKETGVVISKRKSSKSNSPFLIFTELYWIMDLLKNDRLFFKIPVLIVDEYRYREEDNKRKRNRSNKIDKIPIDIIEEIEIHNKEDFLSLTSNIPNEFTAKELTRSTKIGGLKIYAAIKAMLALDLIEENGKIGRAISYKKCNIKTEPI